MNLYCLGPTVVKLYSSQSRLSGHCFPVYKHSIISLLESFNIKTSPFYRPPFFGHMQLFPMWFVAYWYFTSLLRKKLEQILAWSHPISYAVISSWQVHIYWECKDWQLCLGDWINARIYSNVIFMRTWVEYRTCYRHQSTARIQVLSKFDTWQLKNNNTCSNNFS